MLLVASLSLSLIACAGTQTAARSVDDIARAIARSQAVDEVDVMVALQKYASTEDDMRRLALTWERSLPDQPIPNISLVTVIDELSVAASESLRGAACQVVIDVLSGDPVPTGQQFVENYVAGFVLDQLPEGDIIGLAQEFDDLWNDASAGTLTYYDVRFTMMQIRYC
ncbi:MAG: hypothetical protein Q7V88_02550 [Actinomycetota bacterium]|nr:hypothetical protein [Actinomycetota bacterium]